MNLEEESNKEEIGNILLRNVSISDLIMISIENYGERKRKCDEIILNCQLMDDTKNETHGICIQEKVDIESHDLQLMKGKNNMSESFEARHELERETLQDKVDEPGIQQQ